MPETEGRRNSLRVRVDDDDGGLWWCWKRIEELELKMGALRGNDDGNEEGRCKEGENKWVRDMVVVGRKGMTARLFSSIQLHYQTISALFRIYICKKFYTDSI